MPSKAPTPSTPKIDDDPVGDEETPDEIAECYIPQTLDGEPDWFGADRFVWNRLLVAVAQGDISAMRIWITSRKEAAAEESPITPVGTDQMMSWVNQLRTLPKEHPERQAALMSIIEQAHPQQLDMLTNEEQAEIHRCLNI